MNQETTVPNEAQHDFKEMMEAMTQLTIASEKFIDRYQGVPVEKFDELKPSLERFESVKHNVKKMEQAYADFGTEYKVAKISDRHNIVMKFLSTSFWDFVSIDI